MSSNVNVASVVAGAKKRRKRTGKSGPGSRVRSDNRKAVEKNGKFSGPLLETDWSQYRCPAIADFEDILHYHLTRQLFLAHEVAANDAAVNRLQSQTYEERNAEQLRKKEEQRDKAAMSRLFDAESVDASKLEAMKKALAELEAAMAAKALQA